MQSPRKSKGRLLLANDNSRGSGKGRRGSLVIRMDPKIGRFPLSTDNDMTRADSQRVRSDLDLTQPRRSPSKAAVKRQRTEQKNRADKLEATTKRNQKKIKQLQSEKRQLAQELLRERRASNVVIDRTMQEARVLTAQALSMMSAAEKKSNEAETKLAKRLETEREKAAERVRAERIIAARKSARIRGKNREELERLRQQKDKEVNAVKKKYDSLKKKLSESAARLKSQRETWKAKYDEIDRRSQKKLSKERNRRRRMAKLQLDKSTAMEDELQSLINGLNVMNDELINEVEDAKREKREACRNMKKAAALADNRLNKYRKEKDLKNDLKDELTRVLKAQAKQQETLERYEKMIKEMAGKKKSIKKEYEAGRKGGGRWPLWVVEVCCELLVQGTPPSAIPANIATLYETLYGENDAIPPSVDFVRQCRVLVQIIGETITAMKLASCEDWAQILFDATTRRQVPFSAVVISLMGDEATSLDPVIVSSCVILEDETAETQVSGIISKVSSIEHVMPLNTLSLTIYLHIIFLLLRR